MKKILILGTPLLSFLVVPALVFAAGGIDLGTRYAEEVGLGRVEPALVVARLINFALGFLGVIGVVLVLYGGFSWMTSGGNEDKVRAAKKLLVASVIGLGIILSAYVIVFTVLRYLVEATGLLSP
jgi:hypothetical protein